MLARAGLSCVRYCIYVYRYIDIVFHLWRSRVVGSVCLSVCRWFAFLLVLLMLFVRALFAVDIWCTRAIMRCNRFSVLGGVVLPRALSCDCGAFYKRSLCVWLMV